MPRTEAAQFYQLYFQEPGVAEAEFERDPRDALRSMLYWGSGDAVAGRPVRRGARRHGAARRRFSGRTPAARDPARLDHRSRTSTFYAGEFARAGFRGGLNWYRNIDRNWELLAPYAGARVTVPALYMAGDRDLVVSFRGATVS